MDTEKELDKVEALRDLCVEFELKVPAHAVGRDNAGVAMLSECPPPNVVEDLWLPMVRAANRKGLNARYREVEAHDTIFACIYTPLSSAILSGLCAFGNNLGSWHAACENMLWTHNPTLPGAVGVRGGSCSNND